MMLPPKSKPHVRTAELVLSRASCFPGDRHSLGYLLPTATTGRIPHLPIVASHYFSCSSNSNSPPYSSSLCFGSSLLTSSPQSLLRHSAYVTLFMVDCKISVFPSECTPPQERPTLISLCVPSAQQRPGTELGAQYLLNRVA